MTGVVPRPAAVDVRVVIGGPLGVLAAGLHLSRGETRETGLNAVLVVLAAVAAWLATAF